MEIQNCYETEHGEVIVGTPNHAFRTGSYNYNGKTYLIKRDQQQEKTLLETLAEFKFQPRDASTWFLEQDLAIDFLLGAYPMLVEKYRVFGERALSRYKVRFDQPQAMAEGAERRPDERIGGDAAGVQ